MAKQKVKIIFALCCMLAILLCAAVLVAFNVPLVWILVLLTVLMTFITAAVLWRYVIREPNPYEDLELAIEQNEIVPLYQPIVHSDTGDVYGVEVLARWATPSGELVSPASFIPMAEESGLIIPLTRKLMAQAALELPAILATSKNPFHVSFNFTTSHIQSDTFIEDCRTFLGRFPKERIRLTAEILEREPFEKVAALKETLALMQAHDVTIALDDFGTGYSNLNYLNALPIDLIKIDKIFINGLTYEDTSTRLIDLVIDMAKSLKLSVLVEGVETSYQVEYLRKKKVDYFQGYFFSPPVRADELVSWIARDATTYFTK
ncbi:EAL domain-containing protein [Enterobacter wuhouensis]|uniref:EAL domain-containing protein n=1 Tax=Enterobacter wuhouensis TaxID=2529381 RepID=UPI0021E5A0ED|nr:EAL domain-containing protein [Enterobacter wuhouensis]MCV2533304.1 EAL domain-containing protein [Enterobacter wuhouensis]